MKKRKYIIIMIIGIILITAGICIYSINYTKIDNKNNKKQIHQMKIIYQKL